MQHPLVYTSFFFKRYGDHRDLHYPLRRQRQMCIRDRSTGRRLRHTCFRARDLSESRAVVLIRSPESAMFSAERAALNDLSSEHAAMMRVPRNLSRGTKFYRPQETPHYMNARNDMATKSLTRGQRDDARREYQANFPDAACDIWGYQGVDQGHHGACALVAFFNATNICDRWGSLSLNDASCWQRVWAKFGITFSEDIAQTLDLLRSQRMLAKPQDIVYIPIRSSEHREMSFNTSFWTDEARVHFQETNRDLSDEVFQGMPFVFQNGYLVERLISDGVPVVINALEHTRTCVGFNEQYLLFADNWGDLYEEKAKDGDYYDVYRGGFSVVEKWVVYSNMRDIVHFLPRNGPAKRVKKKPESTGGWFKGGRDKPVEKPWFKGSGDKPSGASAVRVKASPWVCEACSYCHEDSEECLYLACTICGAERELAPRPIVEIGEPKRAKLKRKASRLAPEERADPSTRTKVKPNRHQLLVSSDEVSSEEDFDTVENTPLAQRLALRGMPSTFVQCSPCPEAEPAAQKRAKSSAPLTRKPSTRVAAQTTREADGSKPPKLPKKASRNAADDQLTKAQIERAVAELNAAGCDMKPRRYMLPLVARLEAFPMNVEVLASTQIGKSLRRYRKHEDGVICQAVNGLISKWKALVAA
eukprot:TRINITY_DN4830_c0_g1_i2.p1 TRINITY_DN4830_c0_g1~~TRINITY_DN4830_c0_g1_i2.p1  ORF type:complete len:645 (-),score=88.58 TRINITY_DN4830_c0_g1_i2:154-2088(-)